jgi:hypothetical protein
MEFVVPEAKITSYLLRDFGKSRFFRLQGYSQQNWTVLQRDLILIAQNFPRRLRLQTKFGHEYEITGDIVAPNGRTIRLKTGWMMDTGETLTMRFVTAYPA